MRRFRPQWAPSGRRWICQTRSLPGESTRGISGEDKEEKLRKENLGIEMK
jgi:hypothetical protein